MGENFLGQEDSLNDKHKITGIKPYGAVFMMINAIYGAGLVAQPYMLLISGGILPYVVIQLIVQVLAIVTLVALAFLADLKNSFLPQEILLSATAIPTLTYVYLALMISEGFCTLLWFLTLIGDQIQRIAEFSSVLDINDGNIVTGRNLALLLVCVFVIYPFLIPKSLKFQTLPGILSTMGSIVVVLIVIVMFKSSDRIQNWDPGYFQTFSWWPFLKVFPMMIYAYDCHPTAVVVYCSMERRNILQWSFIVILVSFAASIGFTTVAVLGYLTFGPHLKDDILFNYDDTNIFVFLARLALLVSLTMSLINRVVTDRFNIEDFYRRMLGIDNQTGSDTWTLRFHIQTFIWFSSAVVVSIFFAPRFDSLSFLLAITKSIIALWLPGICLLFIHCKPLAKYQSKKKEAFLQSREESMLLASSQVYKIWSEEPDIESLSTERCSNMLLATGFCFMTVFIIVALICLAGETELILGKL
ncbi:solute carrier family 38 member 8-like [Convolutriloba macropyga]|uniref:solute carrier family 38 member 8-like n=1 Tax=Convolutriloba macropyga TaxID=536237 RepID=UPI003F52031F